MDFPPSLCLTLVDHSAFLQTQTHTRSIAHIARGTDFSFSQLLLSIHSFGFSSLCYIIFRFRFHHLIHALDSFFCFVKLKSYTLNFYLYHCFLSYYPDAKSSLQSSRSSSVNPPPSVILEGGGEVLPNARSTKPHETNLSEATTQGKPSRSGGECERTTRTNCDQWTSSGVECPTETESLRFGRASFFGVVETC